MHSVDNGLSLYLGCFFFFFFANERNLLLGMYVLLRHKFESDNGILDILSRILRPLN